MWNKTPHFSIKRHSFKYWLRYLGLATSKPLLAETPPSYRVEGHSESFREAIEQSTQLSNEQKDTWRLILTREGL